VPALASDVPLLVAACRKRHPDDRVPVWFMRQAGRSLPEYRASRKGIGMLESCMRPELVAEITIQPVRRYGVDAAVLYSDIMLPLKAAGVELDIVPGSGPVIARPIRTTDDLEQLRPLDPARLWYVSEAIGLITGQLRDVPLIGFAGAPFTMASYLVEGGASRDYAATRALMMSEPSLWDAMCTRLADLSATFLRAQVEAGVAVVQLFDSWAGSLSAEDYRRYAQPHSGRVLRALDDTGVPRIHFGVGTSELLELMGAAGAEVIGVDWRLPLAEASRRVGHRYALQGNLDPALLSAPWPVLSERVREVISSGAVAPGHIFNLGHGVPPDADPAVLTRIVELVHSEGPQLRRTVRGELAASASASGR
jgi:uroporphyrinogen decarboxylase